MEPDLRSRISLRSIQATKRRNRVTEDRKTGPTPALSLDRTGFALHVTVFCWRAIRSRFAHDKARAPQRAARRRRLAVKTSRDRCSPDGATRVLHFFGRPLQMIAAQSGRNTWAMTSYRFW